MMTIDIKVGRNTPIVLTANEYKRLSENSSISSVRMRRLENLVRELFDLYKCDSSYYPKIDREMYELGLLEGEEDV